MPFIFILFLAPTGWFIIAALSLITPILSPVVPLASAHRSGQSMHKPQKAKLKIFRITFGFGQSACAQFTGRRIFYSWGFLRYWVIHYYIWWYRCLLLYATLWECARSHRCQWLILWLLTGHANTGWALRDMSILLLCWRRKSIMLQRASLEDYAYFDTIIECTSLH